MKAPTPEVVAILQQMKKEHGTLTPENVVAAAKDKSSPLHDYFTWDMRRGFEKNLLTEARELIRSVKIEITVEEHIIRAPKYVKDVRMGNNSGYNDVVTIRKNRDLARATLKAELERALSSLNRAKRVGVALKIRNQLDAPIKLVENIINTLTENKDAAE